MAAHLPNKWVVFKAFHCGDLPVESDIATIIPAPRGFFWGTLTCRIPANVDDDDFSHSIQPVLTLSHGLRSNHIGILFALNLKSGSMIWTSLAVTTSTGSVM